MFAKKILSLSNSQELIIKGSFTEGGVSIESPKVKFNVLNKSKYTYVIHMKGQNVVVKVNRLTECQSKENNPLQDELNILNLLKQYNDIEESKCIQFPIDSGRWVDTGNGGIYPAVYYRYSNKGDVADLVLNYLEKLISDPAMNIMVDRIVNQMLSGVVYLHEHDILHGDIKLENLLIVEGSEQEPEKLQIKIIDFEYAIQLKEDVDYIAPKRFGTKSYLAPEIIRYKKYSHKSDMFAAGCAIYSLHTKYRIPILNNGTPSVIGVEQDLKDKKYNRTEADQFYTKMILELVKENPKERAMAREALKILKGDLKGLSKK